MACSSAATRAELCRGGGGERGVGGGLTIFVDGLTIQIDVRTIYDFNLSVHDVFNSCLSLLRKFLHLSYDLRAFLHDSLAMFWVLGTPVGDC